MTSRGEGGSCNGTGGWGRSTWSARGRVFVVWLSCSLRSSTRESQGGDGEGDLRAPPTTLPLVRLVSAASGPQRRLPRAMLDSRNSRKVAFSTTFNSALAIIAQVGVVVSHGPLARRFRSTLNARPRVPFSGQLADGRTYRSGAKVRLEPAPCAAVLATPRRVGVEDGHADREGASLAQRVLLQACGKGSEHERAATVS